MSRHILSPYLSTIRPASILLPFLLLSPVLMIGGCTPEPTDTDAGIDAGADTDTDAGINPDTDAGITDFDAGVSSPGLLTGIYTFSGVDDPQADPRDLLAFLGDIQNTDYIGLGEGIHTSGGFYALKNRLIQTLVREEGLRVVTWESNMLSFEPFGAFLLEASDCSPQAITNKLAQTGAIFSVFLDNNALDLLQFVCTFNQEHPEDPIYSYGFDMQEPVQERAFILAQIDAQFPAAEQPAENAAAKEQIAACDNGEWATTGVLPTEQYETCMAGIAALKTQFSALPQWPQLQKDTLLEPTLDGYAAFHDEIYYFETDSKRSFEARDIQMAKNFVHLSTHQFAGQRAVLWAHNYHLSEDHVLSATTDVFPPGARTLGSDLRAALGERYQAYGISAAQTGINWVGVDETDHLASIGVRGSFESLLAETQEPFLYVRSNADIMNEAQERRFGQDSWVVGRNFSGVFYLAVSPPMDALFW